MREGRVTVGLDDLDTGGGDLRAWSLRLAAAWTVEYGMGNDRPRFAWTPGPGGTAATPCDGSLAVLVREVTGRPYGVGMDYIPRRTASELPFDSTDILLRYSFEHPALPCEFEDTLEVWSVGIPQYHHEDGCPQCPPEDVCRFHDGTPIGEMHFVKIRGFTADPAWEAADSTPATSRRSSRYAPTPPTH